VDWHFTQLWIKHNPFDTPTSDKLSKLHSSKIKKSNFIYPTINILQRNYPNLYPRGPLKYQSCKTQNDSDIHVSLCNTHLTALQQIFSKFKTILFTHIENNATGLTFDLSERINRSLLFTFTQLTEIEQIPLSHPCLLLIYNIIPTELGQFFYNYIGNGKTRDRVIIAFLTELLDCINQLIWNKHLDNTKKWEKSLHITKNKKKFYRRQRTSKDQNNITRHRIRSSRDSTDSNSVNYLSSHLRKRPYYKVILLLTIKLTLDGHLVIFYIQKIGKLIETIYFLMII
jgi:hypothetical protein